jgi:hypothetical protein
MSDLIFRAYHDSGAATLVCKVTRLHHWVNASYRDQACTRCPKFRPRKDWPR